jgi:hypothetical protein
MRMTTPARSVSAAFFALAALAACSSSKKGGPSPDASGPTPDASQATPDGESPSDGAGTPDAAGSITYWMEERTSEIDLQLGTIQPTQGF